jgi:hypothetical protein
MLMKCYFYLLAVSALGISGQSLAASGCESLLSQPLNENVLWPQVWQALNTQAGCTQNCHVGATAAADMDFSSQNLAVYFLVQQPSSQSNTQLRVNAGDAKASLLYQKLGCATPNVGTRMPPGGHVSVSLQALIYDWIDSGAYGEPAEDPIERDFFIRASFESTRR